MDKEFALGKDIYLETISFIQEKHKDQFRKFSLAPYWVHPIQVACLVQKYKKSHKIDELVISALLHDVVEDCDVSIEYIEEKFGKLVASLVDELTTDEVEKKILGKTEYLCRKVKSMSSWGLVIKLCDRFNNIADLMYADDAFKNKYIKETKAIIFSLEKRALTDTHIEIVKDINQYLKIMGEATE